VEKSYDAWIAALWDLKERRDQVRAARRDALKLLEEGNIPQARRERYAREIVRLDRIWWSWIVRLPRLKRNKRHSRHELPSA
jgi:hypothetical protein